MKFITVNLPVVLFQGLNILRNYDIYPSWGTIYQQATKGLLSKWSRDTTTDFLLERERYVRFAYGKITKITYIAIPDPIYNGLQRVINNSLFETMDQTVGCALFDLFRIEFDEMQWNEFINLSVSF